jgi:hypothetical protein
MHGYPAKVAPAGSNRSDESPHVIIGHRASRENWPPATMPTTASEPTGGPEARKPNLMGKQHWKLRCRNDMARWTAKNHLP